jgi:tRNA threonylcarbamoyladenosine biosynthesis protein TsaE
MNATYKVSSVEETWKLAREFADKLRPGDVVCLEGDLGAGKTTFTQGLAAYLGAKKAVTSPTFCLVVEHSTDKFLLVHMDLYRLHDEDDVLTIGWEDYLQRGAVLFVEWSERAGSLIPPEAWHISLVHGESIDERIISFRKGNEK